MVSLLGFPRVFGTPVGGVGAGGLTYAQRVATLNPLLWLRLRETSGNPIDSGTLAISTTQTGCTQGQNGALGTANEAYDIDPAGGVSGDIITVAANVTLATMTTQRWFFLLNPATLGASNAGRLFAWGAGGTSEHRITFVSSNRLQAFIRQSSTHAQALTNTQEIADLIGAWGFIFMDYDDTTKRIRLWKSVNGVVTALVLGTDTAGVGTVVTQVGDLYIGNSMDRTLGSDGLFDEVFAGVGLWTTEVMQQITDFFF